MGRAGAGFGRRGRVPVPPAPPTSIREGDLKSRDELEREFDVVGERIATPGASLDLATMPREAADSARARHRLIVTIDETGEVREFVTSGFTPDEPRKLAEWPDVPRLSGPLRDLPGPLRLADPPGRFRARGHADEPVREKTRHGTPMRHRGVRVGNPFLAGREDAPELGAVDEETPERLASQAAAAIGNARTHRREQRARTWGS